MEKYMQLLLSDEFGELLRTAQREPLLRRELDPSYIPPGCTEDETWDALTTIRKRQAFFSSSFTYRPEGVSKNWHTIPASLQHSLHAIARLTQQGSTLDCITDERHSLRFVTQQYIEEMLANLSFDGFESSYEDIRAVLTEERPSMNEAEQLAANFHHLMHNLDKFEHAPFDRATLERFYSLLTKGVDHDHSRPATSRSPLENLYASHPNNVSCKYMLEIVSAIGCGYLTEEAQHPIMLSMLVNCQFWRFPIFDRCNNLMGCIASRFYLLKKGYPVFRFVPKIRILEKWKNGGYRNLVRYSFEESHVANGNDIDWTAYYDSVMRIMLYEIRTMEKSLVIRKTADDQALESIANVPYLNHRQREILRQAVLTPETEFRIAAHQNKYDIAYSTARSDFEKLVDRHIFIRSLQGDANIYLATPHLATRLACSEFADNQPLLPKRPAANS